MHVSFSVNQPTQRHSICALGTQKNFNPKKKTLYYTRENCAYMYAHSYIYSLCRRVMPHQRKNKIFSSTKIDFPPRSLPSTLPPTFVHTLHVHHTHTHRYTFMYTYNYV